MESDGVDGPSRNSWFVAKETIGDLSGFVADVQAAWAAADLGFHANAAKREDLIRQIRYALMASSVHTRAARMPPVLMATLVERGLLDARVAVSTAMEHSSDEERANAVVHLVAPLVRRGELELVFERIGDISDPVNRGRVLQAVSHSAHHRLQAGSWTQRATSKMESRSRTCSRTLRRSSDELRRASSWRSQHRSATLVAALRSWRASSTRVLPPRVP